MSQHRVGLEAGYGRYFLTPGGKQGPSLPDSAVTGTAVTTVSARFSLLIKGTNTEIRQSLGHLCFANHEASGCFLDSTISFSGKIDAKTENRCSKAKQVHG